MQSERGAAEKTLKDEIARLNQQLQQRDAAGASASSKLDATMREAAGHKRQLAEVNSLLEGERKTVLDLQSQLAQAQTASEVSSCLLCS
jgi:DNA repair exonuclease SbcCD ATPase subunit